MHVTYTIDPDSSTYAERIVDKTKRLALANGPISQDGWARLTEWGDPDGYALWAVGTDADGTADMVWDYYGRVERTDLHEGTALPPVYLTRENYRLTEIVQQHMAHWHHAPFIGSDIEAALAYAHICQFREVLFLGSAGLAYEAALYWLGSMAGQYDTVVRTTEGSDLRSFFMRGVFTDTPRG